MGIFDQFHQELTGKMIQGVDTMQKKLDDIQDNAREYSEQKQLEAQSKAQAAAAKNADGIIERSKIDPELINKMQRIPASSGYREQIYQMYYADYPLKPFISKDREINTNWLLQARTFPGHSIIPVERMTRFDDNLLPGHIYMLHWLKKNNAKKTPSKRISVYFEYEYGIDFVKEQRFLEGQNFLQGGELTESGLAALEKHKEVIEERDSRKSNKKVQSDCKPKVPETNKSEPLHYEPKDSVDVNEAIVTKSKAVQTKNLPIKKREAMKKVVYEISGADEIRKYWELLDEGIITKEQFEKKKKSILNI